MSLIIILITQPFIVQLIGVFSGCVVIQLVV